MATVSAAPVVRTGGSAGGREMDADTHGQVAVGAGPTTASELQIGSDITLPAGGPWKIFGLWGQVVPATLTAAEFVGGFVRIESASGDMEPNPAPTRFPVPAFGSYLGATGSCPVSPLMIYPIDFTAPGKAVLQLVYQNPIACTVASQCAAGLIFGKTVPERRPFRFVDRVRTTVTSASDTQIGTITLAEKATKITYICGLAAQDGVLTAAEELIGFFRLNSDDVKMTPAQFPLSAAFGAGLGTTIGNPVATVPTWIPVNIPVVGGTRIDCFVDLNTAVTNGAEVEICIAYE